LPATRVKSLCETAGLHEALSYKQIILRLSHTDRYRHIDI